MNTKKIVSEIISMGMIEDVSSVSETQTFVVCGEQFLDFYEAVNFEEVVCTVSKQWLFDLIRKLHNADPEKFLREEYTSYESIMWLDEAIGDNQIIYFEIR